MIQTVNKYDYQAFGLKIISDIKFPELPSIHNMLENPDIVIEINDLSEQWSEVDAQQNTFFTKENLVLFRIAETAVFSVQDGNKIIVSPFKGSEENKIRLYILGTCMGALLLQRKILPLHGSAIAINGKAYALVGERGAGKSTLASALKNKGFKLLSDDVIPVSLDHENVPFVTPSYPQQKLWQESLLAFGIDVDKFNPLFERETKYAVPLGDHFQTHSLELAGVIELIKSDNENVSIQQVLGLEKFEVLYTHTFRRFLISRLGLREWHFNYTARFVNKVDIHQLRRPASIFTAHELADLIINTI